MYNEYYPDRFLSWEDEEIRHLDEFYIAFAVALTVIMLVGGMFL